MLSPSLPFREQLVQLRSSSPVLQVSLFCCLFFLASILYCYVYALLVPGNYASTLAGSLSCVSRDWALWLLCAPVIIALALRRDVQSKSGKRQILFLLIGVTLFLGSVRMLLEYYTNENAKWLSILLDYTPRYLFITAFFLLLALFLAFKQRVNEGLHSQSNAEQGVATKPSTSLSTLVVFKGDSRKLVAAESVEAIHACGNYLELKIDAESYLMRNTMSKVEQELSGIGFARIHRSHMINLNCLDRVCTRKMEAYMHNGETLKIGRKYIHHLPHFSGSA
ncbi:Response regulator of the LytR/AlgR family [Alteromonadaceae bacterium Bs31]|nr:Response regulator of the LytR/AlgR family [Alteromonadaceae bacterium Bs31]